MRYFLLLAFLFIAIPAHAQEGFTMQLEQLSSQGGKVSVFVTRTDAPVNAVEGTLRFDEDVTLSNLQTGGSVVLFWIEAPKIEGNTIRFSGVMPNGFTSVIGSESGNGFLFSIAAAPALGDAVLQDAAVFAHDGKGTRFSIAPMRLSLEDEAPVIDEVQDTQPPEWVIAERGSTPELPAFIVLLAEDRESGISHFEVRESGGGWKRTTTPYVVEHDSWFNRIDVRAYDYAGNVRTTVVVSKVEEKIYAAAPYVLGVIIVGFGLVYLLQRLGMRKKKA